MFLQKGESRWKSFLVWPCWPPLAGGPTSPASASDLEKAITPDVASADIHAVIGGAEPRTFAPNSAPGLGRRQAVQACDFSYLSAMTRHPKSEPPPALRFSNDRTYRNHQVNQMKVASIRHGSSTGDGSRNTSAHGEYVAVIRLRWRPFPVGRPYRELIPFPGRRGFSQA